MHPLKPPDHILIKIYSLLFSSTFEHHSGPQKHTRKTLKKRMSKWSAWIAQATPVFKKGSLQTYPKRPPQKNHQIRGKRAKTHGTRQKKQAKRKYFRPKTDIHLEPSLDVQKSTIYENGLAKRPPKWSQKGRPKWRQKSIKKRYPKSSSLKPPGFLHCRRKGISTEPPEHTHLFQDISRFQARVEYTRTAFRGTSSLASRPTGRHQQFSRKRNIRCNQNLY